MTRNQLFTALNKLCDEMNYSYDINCGGCCYVAAVLAENLENVNIPFKVVCCFSPTHYWIKVSDRNINRDGFRNEYLLLLYYHLMVCILNIIVNVGMRSIIEDGI